MQDAVICSAVRTPIGRFGGSLSSFEATQLGSIVIKEAIKRAKVDPTQPTEVIMGNVLMAGLGQNPARQAAIGAGITPKSGAFTINKVCGSSLKAAMLATQAIRLGDEEIVVAGGMECMSGAPFLLKKARYGYRMGMPSAELIDAMVWDGLWDKYNKFHMGMTGEIVAERFNVTRDDADQLAARSHQLAKGATDKGLFDDEIVPVEIPQRRGDPIILEADEGIRSDTTTETLARLKPIFKKDGLVTAGNASQISDGASALVLMGEDKAHELGVPILAKVRNYGTSGMKPEWVMEAPIEGSRKVMRSAGIGVNDLDLFEHNEAFASASCAVQKTLEIPDEIFNIHGGAVALGHPIGCSGARVLTTLLYALIHQSKKRGLATLCLGGGNSVSMIIER
ncbi:MAG: acetyl-CoA C-acetyltransferase [Candidatus Heimdallarchaeota archaeon]